jgi:hypothetical protein
MKIEMYCLECGAKLEAGIDPIYRNGNEPYCSQDCRGDYDYDDD